MPHPVAPSRHNTRALNVICSTGPTPPARLQFSIAFPHNHLRVGHARASGARTVRVREHCHGLVSIKSPNGNGPIPVQRQQPGGITTVTDHRRPPVVLIVDDQEWSTRSLESILAPSGFAVMRSYTARQGLERALTHLPDIVIVDVDLPDGNGYELCRRLREDLKFGDRTPILLSCPERPTRQQRLEAFKAGAWDVIAYPVDAEELVFKLDAYAKAKSESDRMQDAGLIDESTGLYNLKGLQRRADEMSSWAYRENAALACVVFAPVLAAQEAEEALPALVGAVSQALRAAGRTSDVIGRLGQSEFAVLAPSTNAEGAVKLAQRLADVIQARAASPDGKSMELRAGYDAVTNARETPATAKELLRHATMALRKSRANGHDGADWVSAFEPRTTSS